MARISRQTASFEMVVRELVPGHHYPTDRLLTLCKAKSPRFGFSTLQTFLRHAVDSGALSRVSRGVYVAPDAQGATSIRLAGLEPSSPIADLSSRMTHVEDGVVLITQQQAVLDQKLDLVAALVRQVLTSLAVPS